MKTGDGREGMGWGKPHECLFLMDFNISLMFPSVLVGSVRECCYCAGEAPEWSHSVVKSVRSCELVKVGRADRADR